MIKDMKEDEGLLQYIERTTNKIYKREIDWDEVDRYIKFIKNQEPILIIPRDMTEEDIIKKLSYGK